MEIRYGKDYPNDSFLNQVLEIDSLVYPKDLQGSFQSVSKRYHKNKDCLILAVENDSIIGYFCFFPITEELFNHISNNVTFIDDDLNEKDILENAENSNIFLLSAAIHPEYQNGTAILKLLRSFKAYIKNKGIKSLCAYAISPIGEKLARHLGMEKKYSVEKYSYWETYFV